MTATKTSARMPSRSPAPPGKASGRTVWRLSALVLLLLVLAAFARCLGHDFVNWDDDVYLTGNPVVQQWTAANLRQILTGFTSGNYHPLVLLTYALEFRLFGMNPFGYHLVSLLLHLANTLLVLLFLRRLDTRFAVAFAGAALFSLHPMRVESVAWVSDQKDLLATLFSLAALLAWLRWRDATAAAGSEKARHRWYAAALAFFVLAGGAKGTMLVLPGLLLLVDLLRGRRLDRSTLVPLAPFLAGSALFGILAVAARRSYEAVLLESRYGPVQELFFGAHRLVFYYLARTLWPWAGRAALYPTLGERGSLVPPGLVPAALLALLLLAVLVFTRRRSRTVALGLAFFLVGMAPSLTLPNLGYSADRFSYLPSIGLALVAGVGVATLAKRNRRAAWAVALPILLLLAALSLRQCRVWKDSVSLWTDAIASYPVTPDTRVNRAMAYVYRGEAHAERQVWDAAIRDFTEALAIRDDIPEAWYGRARAQEGAGRKEGALADFDRLLRMQPDHREALLHAARIRYEREEYSEALRLSLRAQELGARVNPEVLEFLRSRVGGSR